MQTYLAVFFISNNSVHERYGTNLLTCEYLVWTDTYSAYVATVSAGQNRRRSTGHFSMALRVRNYWPEKCSYWKGVTRRNKANKDFNKQLIEQTRSQ